MTETERIELVRDLCVFWEQEWRVRNDLHWTSIVWAQVLLDMIAPITGAKIEKYYNITMRQKSIQIMKKKEPILYNKVKPFLNLVNNENK